MFHDMNICYKTKYKLSDIANIINSYSEFKSEIIIENSEFGLSYTGAANNFMNIHPNLKGLELGVKECYDNIKL